MSSLLFSPPLRADSRLSRRKRLLGRSGPWQRKHDFSKIGLTSRSNSTRSSDGGGKRLASSSAAIISTQTMKGRRRPRTSSARRRGSMLNFTLPNSTANPRSKSQLRTHIRSVHGRVAPGAVTGAELQVNDVALLADGDLRTRRLSGLDLPRPPPTRTCSLPAPWHDSQPAIAAHFTSSL